MKRFMYNTSLKIIASIPDFNLLYDIFRFYAQGDDKKTVMDKIISQDTYGIRTEATRGRFLRGIHATLINYKNDSHRQLIYDCFTKSSSLELKKIVVYLQIGINNQLFFELTTQVFLKLYFAGRLTVDKNEFSSYLYNLKNTNEQVNKWDDSTIEEVASKYLTLLRKIGFLKGRQKKEFVHITIPDEAIIFAIYLFISIENSGNNIFDNKYIALLSMSSENLTERIKRIALKDFFEVSIAGNKLSVELTYDYKDVVDAIFKKYQ